LFVVLMVVSPWARCGGLGCCAAVTEPLQRDRGPAPVPVGSAGYGSRASAHVGVFFPNRTTAAAVAGASQRRDHLHRGVPPQARPVPDLGRAMAGIDPALLTPMTTPPGDWPQRPAVRRRQLRIRLIDRTATHPVDHLHTHPAVPCGPRPATPEHATARDARQGRQDRHAPATPRTAPANRPAPAAAAPAPARIGESAVASRNPGAHRGWHRVDQLEASLPGSTCRYPQGGPVG